MGREGCGEGQGAHGYGWRRIVGRCLAGCGDRHGLAEGHREPCGAQGWREADGSRTELRRGEARAHGFPGSLILCSVAASAEESPTICPRVCTPCGEGCCGWGESPSAQLRYPLRTAGAPPSNLFGRRPDILQVRLCDHKVDRPPLSALCERIGDLLRDWGRRPYPARLQVSDASRLQLT